MGSGLLPEQLQGDAFTVVHADGSAGHKLPAAQSGLRGEMLPPRPPPPEADRGRAPPSLVAGSLLSFSLDPSVILGRRKKREEETC